LRLRAPEKSIETGSAEPMPLRIDIRPPRALHAEVDAIAPSQAWERGMRCKYETFQRNPAGERPVR
jgi:hypothetical protein